MRRLLTTGAAVMAALAPATTAGASGPLGLGDPFRFPYVTVEAVLPIGGDDLAIVNDANFGSTGRNPGLPDYSDFIVVDVPGVG